MSAILLDPPNPNPSPSSWTVTYYARWALVAVTLLLTLAAGFYFVDAVRSSAQLEGADSIDTLHYTEPVKLAASQKLEGAKGLFQISMLVIAALWSLLIAKKDEKVMLLKDKPEVIMFVLANALFVSTAICYAIYTDRMATVLTLGAKFYDEPKDLTIMDYRDPLVNNVYERLKFIWAAAMITTAFVLFSAHGLKSPPEKEDKACEPSSSLPAS